MLRCVISQEIFSCSIAESFLQTALPLAQDVSSETVLPGVWMNNVILDTDFHASVTPALVSNFRQRYEPETNVFIRQLVLRAAIGALWFWMTVAQRPLFVPNASTDTSFTLIYVIVSWDYVNRACLKPKLLQNAQQNVDPAPMFVRRTSHWYNISDCPNVWCANGKRPKKRL